jgi:hypothetical protein
LAVLPKFRSSKGRRQQALENDLWQKAVEQTQPTDSDEDDSLTNTSPLKLGLKTFPEKRANTRIFPKEKSTGSSMPMLEEDSIQIPNGTSVSCFST